MKIITISREFGSGGRELGKRLADQLGFAYYDKEILTAIAEKSQMDEEYVEKILEKGLSFHFPYTFGHTFYYPDALWEQELKVFSVQHQMMKELALRTDCVMVGRGSNVILQEYAPLNIFVYAQMESKIKRCRARAPEDENLTDRELSKKILQIDAGRMKYQRQLTDVKWGDKEGYDLCINTTGLDIKKLVPAVAQYASCWFECAAQEKSPS